MNETEMGSKQRTKNKQKIINIYGFRNSYLFCVTCYVLSKFCQDIDSLNHASYFHAIRFTNLKLKYHIVKDLCINIFRN